MVPDFHLPSLFTGSCNVISCVREEETVSLPFKPDRTVIVQHIKDDHVPGIFLEAFAPRQVMPLQDGLFYPLLGFGKPPQDGTFTLFYVMRFIVCYKTAAFRLRQLDRKSVV